MLATGGAKANGEVIARQRLAGGGPAIREVIRLKRFGAQCSAMVRRHRLRDTLLCASSSPDEAASAQRFTTILRISPVTEPELIERARLGDADAFGQLVQSHAGFVRRLTRTVLRNPDDADDAAQDAFFAAWRFRDRFDPRRHFRPWLAQIALNAARDLRRRRTVRQTEPLPGELASGGDTPLGEMERALLKERLDAALAELPERQRLAVVLFDVEGFSHAEVGELLGIPEGTARSDVFHARRRLRKVLGQEEANG